MAHGVCKDLNISALLLCVATMTFASIDGARSTAQAQEHTEAAFQEWLTAFQPEARRRGIPAEVLERAFADVRLNDEVIELDRRQPEFTTPIWRYLENLVSERRIEDGRAAFADMRGKLTQIEQRYGPPASVVTAIWGVESNFGENRGSFSSIEALSTLAYEGRRADFWRAELIDALKIIANGDIAPAEMIGSWAGAMGHTQFIPSSYLSYAVDFDGDGRREIWGDDPTDALASTANYLARFGWKSEEPWGLHVKLPPEFDYTEVGAGMRTTDQWAQKGVRLSNGSPLPLGLPDAEMLLPAGANGPVFLTLNNFRTILRYNNAISYALAVSLLAEQIEGAPKRRFNWPTSDRPLTTAEAKELQESLIELGFDTGGVDGIIGENTRVAIREFQRSQSDIQDGYASARLLDMVRGALSAREAPLLGVNEADRAPGSDVREIQVLLTGMGFNTGGVDGRTGRRTRAAIKEFLQLRGANINPEPGPELLSELRQAARGL